MKYPIITIISPCFNHAKYVIDSLNSIRNQTYPNIEHIIIDDCSKDDSISLIKDWINEFNYDCVFIQHNKNRGVTSTLNETIKIAKGEFWSILATDDIAFVDRTMKLYNVIKDKNEFDVVVSDANFINDQNENITHEGSTSFTLNHLKSRDNFDFNNFGSYPSLISGNYISGSFLIRTKALFEVGLYDESLKLEDWDMWLKLSKKNHFLYLDDSLTSYRFHTTNTMKILQKQLAVDSAKILLKNEQYCILNNIKEYDNALNRMFFSILGNKIVKDVKNEIKYSKFKNQFLLARIKFFIQRLKNKLKRILSSEKSN